MAIAPSKLGRYVVQQGFSWPTNKSDSPNDYSAADETLARRLREKALVRGDVTDAELTEVFQVARREHAEGWYSPFNSPHERVRVFLMQYLTEKGRRWAEPLKSLNLPDEDEGSEPHSRGGQKAGDWRRPAWWQFWKRQPHG